MHRNARTFVEKKPCITESCSLPKYSAKYCCEHFRMPANKKRYLSCWEEQARLKSQAVHHFFRQKKTRWRRRWGDRHETHENVSTSWPSQHWLCFQHAANMLCYDFKIFKIQIWFVLFLLNVFFSTSTRSLASRTRSRIHDLRKKISEFRLASKHS